MTEFSTLMKQPLTVIKSLIGMCISNIISIICYVFCKVQKENNIQKL